MAAIDTLSKCCPNSLGTVIRGATTAKFLSYGEMFHITVASDCFDIDTSLCSEKGDESNMEHYGNTLAKSVIEKRIESANELPLSLQESFAVSNGWKYPTQSEFDTAYKRLEKVRNGNYLTLDEFIAEAGEQRYENTKRVFEQLERIRQTYNTLDPTRIYLYAKYNWCFARPEAIVAAWSSEDHVWYVNNCDTIISESQAKEKIEDCLGFKKEVIEILGTPFYESSDWQFIRFRCRGWYWLWAEGKLTKS